MTVGEQTVSLTLPTDTGSRLRIANDETFTRAATESPLSDMEELRGIAPEGSRAFRTTWPIDAGHQSLRAGQNSCERLVYVRFIDPQDRESETL